MQPYHAHLFVNIQYLNKCKVIRNSSILSKFVRHKLLIFLRMFEVKVLILEN